MRTTNRRAARRNAWSKLTAAIAGGALLGTAGLLAPGAASASVASPVPAVAWHRCPAGSAGAVVGGFSCATVAAPLDYRNRSGPKISLALVEHPATGPASRGVIFFNPGGPGGAGTVQLPAFIGFFPKALLREYDIVSWDPRGSGASTAVQCFPSQAAESAFLGKFSFFPVGRGQQAAYIRRWREFGKICAARNGALLKHVSTADTARDLNLLRQDLRQPRLNYLGISYGTFLGATYANLFPRRVGRMVLDGNLPPEAWTNGGRPNPRLSTYLRMRSDTAAARALGAFLRICGQRSTQACAFSAGSPAATRAKWDALLARLRHAPITVGGTAFSYAEVVTIVSFDLSFVQPFSTPVPGNSAPGWSGTAQDLQLLWMARSGTASARPGTPPAAAMAAVQRYGGAEQTYAVQCDEAPSPPASAYPGLQRLLLRRSGVTALPYLWTFDEPCATWPVRGHDTYNGPWNAPTRGPILVIGNTTDPFLPLQDAIAMTRQLASARLLVVHGYGHTALLNPSTCASTYMTAYFRTGALPRRAPYAARTSRHSRPPPDDTAWSHRQLPMQKEDSMANTMVPERSPYPVQFDVEYPDRPLSRLTSFFRIFVIIPIAIVLGTVSGGTWNSTGNTSALHHSATYYGPAAVGGLLFFGPLLMILFRQKYPRWWFEWNLELQRFINRVWTYLALMNDSYPSTDDHQWVQLDYAYPDVAADLNRWLPLVKWLLAIPHYIVLFFLEIAAFFAVIVAWFAILFTGRYPRGIFSFVEGVFRWHNRVAAYAFVLVTDQYPPFRLAP